MFTQMRRYRGGLFMAVALMAGGLAMAASAGTILGTAKSDVLKGGPGVDKLYGRAGNDKLYGLAGDDILDGGAGNDLLVGGAGKDRFRCGPGRDTALAGTGDTVGKDCELVRGLPIPTSPINTTVGTLAIREVSFAQTDPFGDQAPAGYQYLLLNLTRADGGDPSSIGGALLDASEGAYVRASDGFRGDRAFGGLLHGVLTVGFTVKDSAAGFTLYWPGNKPIPLGK